MHHKNIKLIVRKQLKKQFPNWRRLPRKIKKEMAGKVLAEVTGEYDFTQEIKAPVHELLAIETQLPGKGIISLDEMARFIDAINNSKIMKFSDLKRSAKHMDDEELQFIHGLIDDGVMALPQNLWVNNRLKEFRLTLKVKNKHIPFSNQAIWVSTKKSTVRKGERDASQIYTESNSIASWFCLWRCPSG
ncbi:MAG: hypothetical protein RQ753_10630 [Desulfurivibrionaceae bacterium]|nr:hypothetical protein [Desulfurivibrionaceae bacterium]